MNIDDTWSRCAKEFPDSRPVESDASLLRNLDDQAVRPGRIKRQLKFDNAISSYKDVVAMDVALANIEPIVKTELISEWIAKGNYTSLKLQSDHSCTPSPPKLVDETQWENDRELSPFSQPPDLEKSPAFLRHKKIITHTSVASNKSESVNDDSMPDLTKSPIVSKSKFATDSRASSRSETVNDDFMQDLKKSPIFSKSKFARNSKASSGCQTVNDDFMQDLRKSPIFSKTKFARDKKTSSRSETVNDSRPDLPKSPIISKSKYTRANKTHRFGKLKRRKLDEIGNSCPRSSFTLKKSPVSRRNSSSRLKKFAFMSEMLEKSNDSSSGNLYSGRTLPEKEKVCADETDLPLDSTTQAIEASSAINNLESSRDICAKRDRTRKNLEHSNGNQTKQRFFPPCEDCNLSSTPRKRNEKPLSFVSTHQKDFNQLEKPKNLATSPSKLDNTLTAGYNNILSQDIFGEEKIAESPIPDFQKEENLLSFSNGKDVESVPQEVEFVCLPSISQTNDEELLAPTFRSAIEGATTHLGFENLLNSRIVPTSEVNRGLVKCVGTISSQDLFSDELSTKSLKPVSTVSTHTQHGEILTFEEESNLFSFQNDGQIDPLKMQSSDEEEIFSQPQSCNYILPSPVGGNSELSPPSVTAPVIKKEEELSQLSSTRERLSGSIIQDTEPSPSRQMWEKRITRHPDNDQSTRDNRFLILDSEFSPMKEKFVTDTERIDYDTSSENGEVGPHDEQVRISSARESESDKTVSDIIEEPITQDYLQQAESDTRTAALLVKTVSTSPKISELSSPKERLSVINISAEITPPQSQGSSAPAPEVLDSAKKKKSRPKKGSLSARLQKLITGQVSCVRLWRHQMSQDSTFQKSSAPCTTLKVIETWVECGKNFYNSTVLDDSYNLLNGCFDEPIESAENKDNRKRNLVVMTNPDFVGSVKLLPGSVFKVHLPWEIFNRNSGQKNIILHALYFRIVTNPVRVKSELDSLTELCSHEHTRTKVIHEYDCSCLQSGKIEDSCLVKFTSQRVDVMGEIFKG